MQSLLIGVCWQIWIVDQIANGPNITVQRLMVESQCLCRVGWTLKATTWVGLAWSVKFCFTTLCIYFVGSGRTQTQVQLWLACATRVEDSPFLSLDFRAMKKIRGDLLPLTN